MGRGKQIRRAKIFRYLCSLTILSSLGCDTDNAIQGGQTLEIKRKKKKPGHCQGDGDGRQTGKEKWEFFLKGTSVS